MLEKLRAEPLKVPSPSRDELMKMVDEAMKTTSVDNVKAFKSLFFTNNLDGSEDHKVSEKLFRLIGPELQEFRSKLMSEKAPKNLAELLSTITPPEGIKRKNVEGVELFTCQGDEIQDDVEDEELEKETDKDLFNNILTSLDGGEIETPSGMLLST